MTENAMELNLDTIKKLTRAIATTKDEEVGCDECFAVVDQFVELELGGKAAAEAMPLIEDHLNRCQNCRDEFEALLDAVKATSEEGK
jgi:hypothetical protein